MIPASRTEEGNDHRNLAPGRHAETDDERILPAQPHEPGGNAATDNFCRDGHDRERGKEEEDLGGQRPEIGKHSERDKEDRGKDDLEVFGPSLKFLLWMSSTLSNETPAMNAPTMAERPTASAQRAYKNAIIIAKIKMKSGNFLQNPVASSRSTYLLTTRIPNAPPITMNATAFMATKATAPAVTVPLTASVLMARARRLSTSSMTAAPMIAFAAGVWSFPSSFRTFAVIAILVAVSACPDKDRSRGVKAKDEREPVPANPRDDHAYGRYHAVPQRKDLFYVEFEADDKEEDHGAEFCEAFDKVRVGNKAKGARADKEPHKDKADDGGLVDPRRDKVSAKRDKEEQAHLEFRRR